MIGIPRILGTKQDIYNILMMIEDGEFDQEDIQVFKTRVQALVNTTIKKYPIDSIEDKVVKVVYIGDRIKIGDVVNDGAKVVSFEHIKKKNEVSPEVVGEDGTVEKEAVFEEETYPSVTEVTLDKELSADTTTLNVPDYKYSLLARMDMTVEEAKEVLAKL